jgi:hypothetical protein
VFQQTGRDSRAGNLAESFIVAAGSAQTAPFPGRAELHTLASRVPILAYFQTSAAHATE